MAPLFRIRRGAKNDATHADEALTVREIGRRAASGAAMLTAKGALQQVLGFVSTIVVTRLLLPEDVGVFAIAMTVSSFLWMLGGGQGMAGGLIRRETAPELADLRAYVALQLVIMTFLAVVVAVATMPFGLVGRVTAVMVAIGPITAFRGAGVVVLERSLLYQRLATAETAEMFVYYTWTVVTVALGWGVWGLATATVVRTLVGSSLMVSLSPTGIVWPRYDHKRTRALLGIGVRVQAVELVSALRDQVLVLVTAAIGGVNIVAFWSIVLRVLQAPSMLVVALLRVAFPAMSRMRASGEEPARMVERLLPATAIVFGALLAPLAGAAPAFVPLLLGERWSPAGHVLPLVCLGVVIHVPLLIAGQSYLWAIGDVKSPFHAMAADAVAMTAVGLPLVPVLGVLGLAIGLVVAATLHAAVLARAIQRHAQIDSFRLIGAPVLAWIAATGAGVACAETLGSLVVRTAASTCVALGLYLGLLILTRRELMREILGYAFTWMRGYRRRQKTVPVPAPTS